VTLNGASATVSSASSTQLVFAVPSGATTGVIKVQTAGGSATSSGSFTVTTASAAPVIGSFSPPVAAFGDVVTISGTSFDPSPNYDQVLINGIVRPLVSGATSTTLSLTVPAGATTGRINLRTTTGSTTTSNYLFVAPPGQPASAVVGTAQITALPGTQTVSVGTNQMGLIGFDGIAGQTITMVPINSIPSNNGCNVTMALVSPRGVTLDWGYLICNGSHVLSDQLLTETGTYAVRIANGGAAGGVGVTVYSISSPLIGTVTPTVIGTNVGPIAITAPGQTVRFAFNGSSGGRIAIATNTSFGCGPGITISNPDGTNLYNSGVCGNGFSGAISLPYTGSYLVNYNPNGGYNGTVSFIVYAVPPDPTLPITVDGPAVSISTASVGQNGHLTFNGTAGQRLYLVINTPTGTNTSGAPIQLLDHTTSQWMLTTNGGAPGSNWTYYSGLETLKSTGAYSIDFQPYPPRTGWGATFQLVSVPPDVTSPITVDGGAVSIATTAKAQSAHLTFNGTAGQRLYLTINTPTGSGTGAAVQLLDHTTNQWVLATVGGTGSGWTFYSGLKTLPSTGPYTVDFQPYGTGTWGATFQLVTVPPDPTSPITVDGGPVSIATTATGQSAHLTFSGSIGQRLYMYIDQPTGTNNSNINLFDPSGNQVVYVTGGQGAWTYYSKLITLRAAGTFNITISPQGSGTYGARFLLATVPPDPASSITVDGGPVSIATTATAQSAHLTFSGSVGQRLYMYIDQPTGTGNSDVNLFDPSGNQVLYVTGGLGTWTYYSKLITLRAAGTFSITFTPQGMGTYGARFLLATVPPDPTSPITVDGGPVSIATAATAQSAHLTFSGSVNQQLYMHIDQPTGTGNSDINLFDPSGNEILYVTGGQGTWTYCSSLITLRAAGTFSITFTPQGMGTYGGRFNLTSAACH
jgi:hypothetical protein